MTITARDVYDCLRPRVGYPPTRAQDIDHVVRVLNAQCRSAVTVRDLSVLDLPAVANAAAEPAIAIQATSTQPHLPAMSTQEHVHPGADPRAALPTDETEPTATMTTQVYLNHGTQWDGWASLDVQPRLGPDSMRGWLIQQLKLCMLGPVPPSEVPDRLRPQGHRWTATWGCTEGSGYVLVITDVEHLP